MFDTGSVTQVPGDVGGTVPATLALTLGPPASFGAFTPGVAREYSASTTANVISTAGDARAERRRPERESHGASGQRLVLLPQPLRVRALNAANTAARRLAPSPLNLLAYDGPISNDAVTLQFRQSIGANDALRTGTYSKTLTFTCRRHHRDVCERRLANRGCETRRSRALRCGRPSCWRAR